MIKPATLLLSILLGSCQVGRAEEPLADCERQRPESWHVLDVVLSEHVGRVLGQGVIDGEQRAVGVLWRGLPDGYRPQSRHIPIVVVRRHLSHAETIEVDIDGGKGSIRGYQCVEVVDVAVEEQKATVTCEWIAIYRFTITLRKKNGEWTVDQTPIMGLWHNAESKASDSVIFFSPDYRILTGDPPQWSTYSQPRYRVLGDTLVLTMREVAVPLCVKFQLTGNKLALSGLRAFDRPEERPIVYRRAQDDSWDKPLLAQARKMVHSWYANPAEFRLELNRRRDGRWSSDQSIVLQTAEPKKDTPGTNRVTYQQAGRLLEILVDERFFQHAGQAQASVVPESGREIVLRTGGQVLYWMPTNPNEVDTLVLKIANLFYDESAKQRSILRFDRE